MRENILRVPVPETSAQPPKPPGEPKSANDSEYGLPSEFPHGFITETIVADDEFEKAKRRLTRADFSEEAILAKKRGQFAPRKSEQAAEAPEVQFRHTETVIADDKFSEAKARLTRADFTPEGIERARAFSTPGYQASRPEPTRVDPLESWKIDPRLRIGGEDASSAGGVAPSTKKEKDIPPLPPRLIRADFPGEGSAVMPTLTFKTAAKPKANKGFFKRFLPKFITRYFSSSEGN